jgi:hypothetical protein
VYLYELALELGERSSDLADRARALGFDVGAGSTLTPEQVTALAPHRFGAPPPPPPPGATAFATGPAAGPLEMAPAGPSIAPPVGPTVGVPGSSFGGPVVPEPTGPRPDRELSPVAILAYLLVPIVVLCGAGVFFLGSRDDGARAAATTTASSVNATVVTAASPSSTEPGGFGTPTPTTDPNPYPGVKDKTAMCQAIADLNAASTQLLVVQDLAELKALAATTEPVELDALERLEGSVEEPVLAEVQIFIESEKHSFFVISTLPDRVEDLTPAQAMSLQDLRRGRPRGDRLEAAVLNVCHG